MLEVSMEKSLREIQRVENDDSVICRAPSNQSIGQGIVDHLISLQNERCYNVVSRVALFHHLIDGTVMALTISGDSRIVPMRVLLIIFPYTLLHIRSSYL